MGIMENKLFLIKYLKEIQIRKNRKQLNQWTTFNFQYLKKYKPATQAIVMPPSSESENLKRNVPLAQAISISSACFFRTNPNINLQIHITNHTWYSKYNVMVPLIIRSIFTQIYYNTINKKLSKPTDRLIEK